MVQTLLPVTFGYSLGSEAVVMRQLRRWKRVWRRSLTRSHKITSMEPPRSCWNVTTSALQPGEITSMSFMCVLSIKVPIRKSLETYLMILVYIYIYIYIYIVYFLNWGINITTRLLLQLKPNVMLTLRKTIQKKMLREDYFTLFFEVKRAHVLKKY